jgi:prepilin-type N-terminal cleavage/methylation domain-containing protein/prepilin-type processing-associated H-X9-DG protein
MKRNRAFTLVELLVVIGIIALLVGILLPALGAARRQANALKCAAELREIGTCFKMYELDSKGFWPVARINGWTTSAPYNIDGVDYPTTTPAGGQAYWFTFLAKYATKAKMGAASGTDSNAALQSRKTIFFGCPAWEGYMQGGVVAGDTNVVQPGYGMNPYPTFASRYPRLSTFPPEPANAANYQKEYAVHSTDDSMPGNFLKAKTWTDGSRRMLIADSKFWLAQADKPPTLSSYPPSVVAQPVLTNTTSNPASAHQFDSGTTVVDIYRHGSYPKSPDNIFFSPTGGKVGFNILYADGHVVTVNDAKEAYRSLRMKFPG